ncbi:MAG TPA: hypothetical protein VF041_22150 [Gemmatimonadaceae bacterium]
MRLPSSRTAATLLCVALFAAGCGGQHDAPATDSTASAEQDTTSTTDQDTASTAAATPTASTPQPGASTSAPITVDDIDRWQLGMAAEMDAVKAAAAKLASAKTGEDTVNAMFDATDMGTREEGAKAAGVDEERYQFIRTTLSSAVSQLTPIEQELNVAQMPKSMVDEMKKNREAAVARMSADIPPDVMAALRPRAVMLRKQDLTLSAARLKEMGQAR